MINHNKKSACSSKSGFTLIEVMMAMFIMSMVTAGVYGVLITGLKMWHSTSLDCTSSNKGSMAVERFVYGDGWTPGLRGARAASVSLVSTGASWVLSYNTPDATNNYFHYNSTLRTLSFCVQGSATPRAIARNILSASVIPDTAGIRLNLQIAMTEGRFSTTNNFSTYVCYRN